MERPPQQLFPFIRYILSGHWLTICMTQAAWLSWAINEAVWPLIIARVVDGLVLFADNRAGTWSALAKPVLLGAILWLLIETMYRVAGFLSARLFARVSADTRMILFRSVMQQSTGAYSPEVTGNLANKIAEMPETLVRMLQKIMTYFVPTLVSALAAVILLAPINLPIAILLLISVCVHLCISLGATPYLVRATALHSESRNTLAGIMVDVIANQTIARLFDRIPYENAYIEKYQADEQAKNAQARLRVECVKVALGLSMYTGLGIVLSLMIYRAWLAGTLSVGDVIFIVKVCWNICTQVWLTGNEIPEFFREMGVCRQSLTLLEEKKEVIDLPNAPVLRVTKGEIVFDHVFFSYPLGTSILSDFSLAIPGGQKVGLVGYSGSGKSTFVNLILRLFDVDRGAIFIDGQDIKAVSLSSLRASIGIIPQEAGIFNRSILENIKYGKPEALIDQMYEAAQQAHAHDFISTLPEGYQTLAGERGSKLSGGQRQRIAIARALLKNAPLMIMDEATSAQDAITERLIQESLGTLLAGKTTIVIAHRLTTLQHMDRILVFDKGRVVEDGTHQVLLEQNGFYTTLWNTQINGFLIDEDGLEIGGGVEPGPLV